MQYTMPKIKFATHIPKNKIQKTAKKPKKAIGNGLGASGLCAASGNVRNIETMRAMKPKK